MKILYTSDIHGNHNYYYEIIKLTKREKINAIILGGDLLPKEGRFIDSLQLQKDFIKNQIRQYITKLKNEINVSVYIILGNDDWADTLSLFLELEEENLIHLLHSKAFNLTDEFLIVGYPYVPPTPFSPKDFEKRDQIGDPVHQTTNSPAVSYQDQIIDIDEISLFTQRTTIQHDMETLLKHDSNQKVIYVMHAPPYNTFLDRLYNRQPVGSKAIKNFILKEQPYLTLHGHIHESPSVSGNYYQKIGKTTSINPGQTGKYLSAVIFDPKKLSETLTHTLYKNQFTAS